MGKSKKNSPATKAVESVTHGINKKGKVGKPQTNGKAQAQPNKGVKRPANFAKDSSAKKFIKTETKKIQVNANTKSTHIPLIGYQVKTYSMHNTAANATAFLESLKSTQKKHGLSHINHIVDSVDRKCLVFYHKFALTAQEVADIKKSTKAVEVCNISSNVKELKGTLLLKFADVKDADKAYGEKAVLVIGKRNHMLKYMRPHTPEQVAAKNLAQAKKEKKEKKAQPKVEEMLVDEEDDEDDEDEEEDADLDEDEGDDEDEEEEDDDDEEEEDEEEEDDDDDESD